MIGHDEGVVTETLSRLHRRFEVGVPGAVVAVAEPGRLSSDILHGSDHPEHAVPDAEADAAFSDGHRTVQPVRSRQQGTEHRVVRYSVANSMKFSLSNEWVSGMNGNQHGSGPPDYQVSKCVIALGSGRAAGLKSVPIV